MSDETTTTSAASNPEAITPTAMTATGPQSRTLGAEMAVSFEGTVTYPDREANSPAPIRSLPSERLDAPSADGRDENA